ncbi:MAG: hypothetical protein KF858_13065 [Candidatus Sumerlaeia bacterium]|nr:hypothetical protein [Candidatus Sumerlaeia bacterium]
MAAFNHLALLNRIAVVRDYAALWQQFFTFFAEELTEKTITADEEAEFANIVSLLAVNHYKFQELTRGYFDDAGKVIGVLEEAVSLEQMQLLPPATFSKMQLDWHTLFIGMHKTLGKMISELPPKQLAELQGGGAHAAG